MTINKELVEKAYKKLESSVYYDKTQLSEGRKEFIEKRSEGYDRRKEGSDRRKGAGDRRKGDRRIGGDRRSGNPAYGV